MSVVLGFNIKTIFKFILSKSNQNGSYQITNDIKVDFLSNQRRQKKWELHVLDSAKLSNLNDLTKKNQVAQPTQIHFSISRSETLSFVQKRKGREIANKKC